MFETRSPASLLFPEAHFAHCLSLAFGDLLLMKNNPLLDSKILITNQSRGYQVCGIINRSGKPCQRIGICPFHLTKTPLLVPTHRELALKQEDPSTTPSNPNESPLTDQVLVQEANLPIILQEIEEDFEKEITEIKEEVQDPILESHSVAEETPEIIDQKSKKKRGSAVIQKRGGYFSWANRDLAKRIKVSPTEDMERYQHPLVHHPHYQSPYPNIIHQQQSSYTSTSTTYSRLPSEHPVNSPMNYHREVQNAQPFVGQDWNHGDVYSWAPAPQYPVMPQPLPQPLPLHQNYVPHYHQQQAHTHQGKASNEWINFLSDNNDRNGPYDGPGFY